ncbi:MAG: membrane protein insertion efficiency factor YidD [Chthoniobacterales bacterium]
MFDWTRPPASQWSVRAYDVAVIGGYRTAVRPITRHVVRCRFQPTCSRYSQEAMQRHGFPVGFVLTSWRLIRCGPWIHEGTRDPVP